MATTATLALPVAWASASLLIADAAERFSSSAMTQFVSKVKASMVQPLPVPSGQAFVPVVYKTQPSCEPTPLHAHARGSMGRADIEP